MVWIVLGQSPAAMAWWDRERAQGAHFAGSQMLDLELTRAIRNKELAGLLRPGQVRVDDYLDEFDLFKVTAGLLDEAKDLGVIVGGADSLHIAAAMRAGTDAVAVVTHDRQMATAAAALGFEVFDPVTDDPRREALAGKVTS